MKRFIFVDDDFEIDQHLETFEQNDFQLAERLISPNPTDVLPSIAKNKPDILVLDALYEKRDLGLELCKTIRTKYPKLPVVVFSEHLFDDNLEKPEEYMELEKEGYVRVAYKDNPIIALIEHMKHLIDDPNYKVIPIDKDDFGFVVGDTEEMRAVAKTIKKHADGMQSVFIYGESGTGKELVAKAFHKLSNREEGKYVAFNVAGVNATVAENELFGHEKGAFTGAHQIKKGLFEMADGGTIFLDEIGDLDYNLQSKLLRVIGEKTVRRVGGNQEIKINVRVLSASNKNLKEMVEKKQFREDLYYRLNQIFVSLPPLRSRRGDIPELCGFIINELNKVNKYDIAPKLLPQDKKKLMEYSWEGKDNGNIRKLKSILEKAYVEAKDDKSKILYGLEVEDISNTSVASTSTSSSFVNDENFIQECCNGKVKLEDLKKLSLNWEKQRENTLEVIRRLTEKNKKRPGQRELAKLFSVTQDTIKQFLHNKGQHPIKLRELD